MIRGLEKLGQVENDGRHKNWQEILDQSPIDSCRVVDCLFVIDRVMNSNVSEIEMYSKCIEL